MPTINEVIERNDKIKPNAYSNQVKAGWLYRLDSRISADIMHTDPPAEYKFPEDGDKTLLVPEPYDELYDYYVQAMIDFYNKEINSYNNSMVMYNSAVQTYARYYIQHNEPPSYYNFRSIL
jgi:hypothetical protein